MHNGGGQTQLSSSEERRQGINQQEKRKEVINLHTLMNSMKAAVTTSQYYYESLNFPNPGKKTSCFCQHEGKSSYMQQPRLPFGYCSAFFKKKKTAFEYLPCRCIQNKLTPANPFSQALAHTVGLGLRMQANI